MYLFGRPLYDQLDDMAIGGPEKKSALTIFGFPLLGGPRPIDMAENGK